MAGNQGYFAAIGYLDATVNSSFNQNEVSKGLTLSTGEWGTGYESIWPGNLA